MNIDKTMTMEFGYEMLKNTTKLSLSNFNVNQSVLNNLGKYLQTEECIVSELIFDGINLSNMNYLCCITPNSKVNKLWLRRCQLKDKGIEDLMTVLNETNIKTQLNLLCLDRNGITCKGAKQIAQVLRTNRTLQSLSLASNLIKDEGIFALMNVLSKFKLDDHEKKWKFKHEQRRTRVVEYLMDAISCIELEEKQRSVTSNSTINSAIISLTDEDSLRQKAEKLLVPHIHPYLTDQLLRSGTSFHCPDNRCSPNVLSFIEEVLQYQEKICLPGEGIKDLKIGVEYS